MIIIKVKNFSSKFSGGINSFCLSIMVVAIFQIYKSNFKVEMLMNFLKKYGYDFNYEK